MNRRLRFATARQVFEAFPTALSDIEAKPADIGPVAFVEALAGGPTPEDGLSFCAYLLPKREAVWWACNCIRSIEGSLSEGDEKLLSIAESWVDEPEEVNRRAALLASEGITVRSPSSWALLAAAWSGGSMVADAERPVPPPAHLTAQAVRAAVLTSLARVPTRSRRTTLDACIATAMRLVTSESA